MGNKLAVKDFDAKFRQALLQKLSISESIVLQSIVATKHIKKQLSELIDEYLKFMRLMQLFPHLRFSPSGIVDQVWHEHIQFTREYRTFCKKHFGKYVNHAPTVVGYSITNASDNQRCYANTLYFYALYFCSTPSTVYWPTDNATNDLLTEMRNAKGTFTRSLKIKNLHDKRRKKIVPRGWWVSVRVAVAMEDEDGGDGGGDGGEGCEGDGGGGSDGGIMGAIESIVADGGIMGVMESIVADGGIMGVMESIVADEGLMGAIESIVALF